ncbi:hypothetical protein VE00_01643 [Pseudogymnoascus sp. WSF 3629]|nr:hypothetical protein VE00_01643 [Pseudogymnoascus sp. WSF 3629]
MNVINSRYPYPLSRPLLEPRYPTSRSLEPYMGSRYGLEPVLPRSRGYVNCACGAAISPLGNHLCRTCVLTTHAANQVLNIRGGDHCDCPACDLAGLDDDRELRDVMEAISAARVEEETVPWIAVIEYHYQHDLTLNNILIYDGMGGRWVLHRHIGGAEF